MAPPDTSDFASSAYDSAWFTLYTPTGLRVVLTTGKEAILRGQRGLLRWLQALPPDQREFYMVSDDGAAHRIVWPGSQIEASPSDKVFTPDASIGLVTLEVLAEYAAAHGHDGEARDIGRVISERGHPLKAAVLSELLRAGWSSDVDLPDGVRLPTYNRRPPTPRGAPQPLPVVAAQIRTLEGGDAIPVMTRDGVTVSDVSYVAPPLPGPAGQAGGGVATVERSTDSFVALTPDEVIAQGGWRVVALVGGAVLAIGGAVILLSRGD